MTKEFKQYSVGKDHLYYFYRSVILPWELDWAKKKFLLAEGELNTFCQAHNLNIKSFDSAKKLRYAVSNTYEEDAKVSAGIVWFVRKDTKPKDLLRQLRNCFAHGNFTKRQKNKTQCIVFENIDKGTLKAQGILPLDVLSDLVRAASSCGV